MRDYKITPKASEKIDLDVLRDHCADLDLSNNDNLNFWLYCQIAMTTGLRSVDILNMKVSDISFQRRFARITEKKTGKKVTPKISPFILGEIDMDREFVIWNEKYTTKVSLMTINRRLKKIFEGTDINVSSHSIRKSAATRIYKAHNNDIIRAMEFLNHGSPVTTKNYLGITKEEKDSSYDILQNDSLLHRQKRGSMLD